MKNITLILATCLGGLNVCAQSTDPPKERTHYLSLCMLTAAEPFFCGTKQGGLNVSFPYRVTDAGGTVSDSIFHSRIIRPFLAFKVFIVPLSLEIGDRHFFVLARFCPILMGDGGADAGYRYSIGYGRNFFIGKKDPGTKMGRILFKPSLNVEYINYQGRDNGSPFYLGSINNQDRTIQFDGGSADPTYTHTTGSGNHRVTHTDSAQSLNIYYGQREWMIQPKITFSNSPYEHWLHWEVYIGYTIPFSQKGKIKITQNDANVVANKNINDNALLVEYNNTTISKTPYYLNGLNVGFALGINSSHQLKDRGRRKTI
jgi:hypothetical protein